MDRAVLNRRFDAVRGLLPLPRFNAEKLVKRVRLGADILQRLERHKDKL